MATVGQIDKLFCTLAPKELSEPWDNDGIMLCKNTDAPVKRVLTALEVRENTVDYAIKGGFDLIVTHHPFIFSPLSRITDMRYNTLHRLMSAGISVLSYHTRLDSADTGVNDTLANVLGLCDITPFGGQSGKIGRIGKINSPSGTTAKEFALLIKKELGNDSILMSGDPDKNIHTIAVVGGAGKDFVFEAFKAGADAYVTSELAHHIFIAANESGHILYDCGHYFTENLITGTIKAQLDKAFPDLYTEVFDVKSPYYTL